MVDSLRQSIELQNAIAGDEELSGLFMPEKNVEIADWTGQPIGSRPHSSLEIGGGFFEQSSRDSVEAADLTDNNLTFNRQLSDLMEENELDEENREDVPAVEACEEKSRSDSFDDFVYDSDNEEEEEQCDTESSSLDREKVETEVRAGTEDAPETEPDEVDILADIPAEILRDRQALIEKLREFRKEEPLLRRKNRLYQYWVARVMDKKHQIMTPEDETLSSRGSENRYIKELLCYKTSIDEIEARQAEINVELGNIKNNLKTILEEDKETFRGLLDRQKEVGVGLIYEKSARILTVKAIDAMIRRQILRRDLLNRDRFRYIFHRHRYEDLRAKLRRVETLGEGMTIMDYEVMRFENYCHKEKLEEREKELEKLYINIQAILIALANYKEKDTANIADIRREENRLEEFKSKALKARNEIFEERKKILRIRRLSENKKRRGGLLFSLPALHAMEETLKNLEDLKSNVGRMFPQVKICLDKSERSARAERSLKVDETRTTVTRMTKVKCPSPGSRKPGRC